MDAGEIRKRILQQYGIRVDAEMSDYVLRRLGQAGMALKGVSIPVIGGDARTGVAVRELLDPQKLTMAGESA